MMQKIIRKRHIFILDLLLYACVTSHTASLSLFPHPPSSLSLLSALQVYRPNPEREEFFSFVPGFLLVLGWFCDLVITSS